MTRRGWKKELKNYLDLQVRFRLSLLIGDTNDTDTVYCIERNILYRRFNITPWMALVAMLEVFNYWLHLIVRIFVYVL